jgi:D-3-phosphoglycerate dehydrogenase
LAGRECRIIQDFQRRLCLTKPKILVADPLPDGSLEKLRQQANVEVAYKLSKEMLQERIGEFHGLVVRSETKVTGDILEHARNLQVIARAGVGVDNIDVEAATRKGIVVLNSPEGNTLAAAEHTMALMLALARKIPHAHHSLRSGEWTRSRFVGVELYGKTLGVIGLGRIGREVASRAKAFGMKVLGHDPFVNETYAAEIGVLLLPLEEILQKADFLTLHVPLNTQTQNFINKERLTLMHPGSYLINCARGGLVDEDALFDALSNGRLAGAALDVFVEEPPKHSRLLQLDNVVLTPHLGASTQEAQQRVALDVVEQMLDIFQGKPARSPVNIPALSAEKFQFLKPYLFLLEKMGLFLSQICRSPLTEVRLLYEGEIAKENLSFLSSSALKGLLWHELGESINFVNALVTARSRGIKIEEAKLHSSGNYTNLVSIEAKTNQKQHHVSGSVFDGKEARILEVDGYVLNVFPKGCKLLTWHVDRPGIVGDVGTILGRHDINIAEMQLGRDKIRGQALMILSVDDFISSNILNEIRSLDGIEEAQVVYL